MSCEQNESNAIGPRQAGLRTRNLRPSIAARPSSSNVTEDASGTDAEATAISPGLFSPEISDAFTVAPEVVYSPIVPAPKFVSKICPRLVAGMTQTVADATKPKRIKRMFIGFLSNPNGKVISANDPLQPRAGTAWPIRIRRDRYEIGL